jgi:acetate CoA/acetoacetate CoA-transferase alpha subunit
MKKTTRLADAVARIPDGAGIMIGGFMGVGTPSRLIEEIVRQGRRDLTVIANDTARPGIGVGRLIEAGLVRKMITSHIGTNPETQRRMLAGEIEVELVPQGTLAERIRAGGYGLGGVLTPTGIGTAAAEGKPTVEIDGRTFLLEKPLKADFAFIQARQADYLGNLAYALTARNFNPLMAMAAEVVMAEARDIVPVGVIPPDAVMTPAVLVDHLILKERDCG